MARKSELVRHSRERERESYIHIKGNKKYTRHRFMTVVLEIIAAGMLDDIKGMLVAALSSGLCSMKA